MHISLIILIVFIVLSIISLSIGLGIHYGLNNTNTNPPITTEPPSSTEPPTTEDPLITEPPSSEETDVIVTNPPYARITQNVKTFTNKLINIQKSKLVNNLLYILANYQSSDTIDLYNTDSTKSSFTLPSNQKINYIIIVYEIIDNIGIVKKLQLFDNIIINDFDINNTKLCLLITSLNTNNTINTFLFSDDTVLSSIPNLSGSYLVLYENFELKGFSYAKFSINQFIYIDSNNDIYWMYYTSSLSNEVYKISNPMVLSKDTFPIINIPEFKNNNGNPEPSSIIIKFNNSGIPVLWNILNIDEFKLCTNDLGSLYIFCNIKNGSIIRPFSNNISPNTLQKTMFSKTVIIKWRKNGSLALWTYLIGSNINIAGCFTDNLNLYLSFSYSNRINDLSIHNFQFFDNTSTNLFQNLDPIKIINHKNHAVTLLSYNDTGILKNNYTIFTDEEDFNYYNNINTLTYNSNNIYMTTRYNSNNLGLKNNIGVCVLKLNKNDLTYISSVEVGTDIPMINVNDNNLLIIGNTLNSFNVTDFTNYNLEYRYSIDKSNNYILVYNTNGYINNASYPTLYPPQNNITWYNNVNINNNNMNTLGLTNYKPLNINECKDFCGEGCDYFVYFKEEIGDFKKNTCSFFEPGSQQWYFDNKTDIYSKSNKEMILTKTFILLNNVIITNIIVNNQIIIFGNYSFDTPREIINIDTSGTGYFLPPGNNQFLIIYDKNGILIYYCVIYTGLSTTSIIKYSNSIFYLSGNSINDINISDIYDQTYNFTGIDTNFVYLIKINIESTINAIKLVLKLPNIITSKNNLVLLNNHLYFSFIYNSIVDLNIGNLFLPGNEFTNSAIVKINNNDIIVSKVYTPYEILNIPIQIKTSGNRLWVYGNYSNTNDTFTNFVYDFSTDTLKQRSNFTLKNNGQISNNTFLYYYENDIVKESYDYINLINTGFIVNNNDFVIFGYYSSLFDYVINNNITFKKSINPSYIQISNNQLIIYHPYSHNIDFINIDSLENISYITQENNSKKIIRKYKSQKTFFIENRSADDNIFIGSLLGRFIEFNNNEYNQLILNIY